MLFWAGAKYYECGDGFTKYATAAYLADAVTVEWLLACACVLWTVGLAFVLRRFSPKPTAEPSLEESAPISRDLQEDWSVRRSRAAHCVGTIRSVLCLLAWFLTLAVVGGIPTVLYVLTYSLPDNNMLALERGWEVDSLGHVLALYLSSVSGGLIPFLTRPTAHAILKHGWDRRDLDEKAGKAKRHEVENMLAIIARTLVVVVLPVGSVLLLDNGCFAMWTSVWNLCRSEGGKYFSKQVAIDYFLYFGTIDYTGLSNGTEIVTSIEHTSAVSGTIDLALLDNNAVCSTSYQSGRCSRDLLEILCPLFTSKLLYAILLAALQPVIAPLRYPVMQCLKKRCWRPFVVCLSRRFFGAASSTAATRTEEEDEAKNDDGSLDEPDPMLVLIWYETAFIFGCLSPFLVVLLAVQLFADATIFEWKLSRAPSASDSAAQPLPILRWPLQCHLHLVLALQTAMVVFFFFDNEFHGRYLVVMLPLVIAVSVTLTILDEVRRAAPPLWSRSSEEGDLRRRESPSRFGLDQQQSAATTSREETETRANRGRGTTMADFFDVVNMLTMVRSSVSRQDARRDDGSSGRARGQVRDIELSSAQSPARNIAEVQDDFRGSAVTNPLSAASDE